MKADLMLKNYEIERAGLYRRSGTRALAQDS